MSWAASQADVLQARRGGGGWRHSPTCTCSKEHTTTSFQYADANDLPSTVDWRKKNAVTPVSGCCFLGFAGNAGRVASVVAHQPSDCCLWVYCCR